MKRTTKDRDSVFAEPQFHSPTGAEKESSRPPTDSVWMEPLQSGEGKKKGDQLYADWISDQKAKETGLRPWIRMVLYSLFAGPIAIFTALFTQNPGAGILIFVVAGPLIEEIGKVLLPWMVLEKNPAKFSCCFQIIFCATAGGLVFSIIENVIYLNIYFPNAGEELIRWRWTVCVLLHTGCSFIAGCGLAKAWSQADQKIRPVNIETAIPLFISSVAVHGGYNFLAMFMNPIFE